MTRIHWIVISIIVATVAMISGIWLSRGSDPEADPGVMVVKPEPTNPDIVPDVKSGNEPAKNEAIKVAPVSPIKMAGTPSGNKPTKLATTRDQIIAANVGGLAEPLWKGNSLPLIPLSTGQTKPESVGHNQELPSWNGYGEKVYSRLGNVTGLAWLEQGQKFLVAQGDRKGETLLSVRDVASNSIIWKKWIANGVTALAVSPDGNEIAIGSSDNHIALLNSKNGTARLRMVGHLGDVIQMKYDADGKQLISLSWDRTAAIWDVASGKLLIRSRIHEQTPAAFSLLKQDSSSRRLLISGFDGSLQWWKVGKDQLLPEPIFPQSGKRSRKFLSGDGRFIVKLDEKLNAILVNGVTGKIIEPLAMPKAEQLTEFVFSPDGNLVAGGTITGKILIWSTKTRKIEATLKGHTAPPRMMSFSQDSKSLVSSSFDGSLMVWNIAKAKQEKRLIPAADEIYPLALTQRSVVSADGNVAILPRFDGSIDVIDPKSRRKNRTLTGHQGHIKSLAVIKNGERVVAGYEGGSIAIWNLKSKTSGAQEIKAAKTEISAVAINASRLIAGTSDGELIAVDYSTNEIVKTIKTGTNEVKQIRMNAAGTLAAVIVGETELQFIRLPSLEQLQTIPALKPLENHETAITEIALSPSGNRLAMGNSLGQVDLWDVRQPGDSVNIYKTGTITIPLDAVFSHFRPVDKKSSNRPLVLPQINTVRFVSQGNRLLVSAGNAILTVSCSDAKITSKFTHSNLVTSLAVSPANSRLLAISTNGDVTSWLPALQIAHRIVAHKGDAKFVVVPPDGKTIISGGSDKTVKIWNAATGASIKTLTGGIGVVTRGSMTSSGNTLATCGYSSAVELWDIPQQKIITKRYGHSSKVVAVALSPNEKRIASAEQAGPIWIRSLPGFKTEIKIPKQELPVDRIVWMPDGKHLITSTGDWKQWHLQGHVRIWNTATGKQTKELKGLLGQTSCLLLSPDGRYLITTSGDSLLRVWETKTWTVRAIIQHENHARGIAFLDRGRLLVCVRYPNRGFILDTQSGEIRHRFKIPTSLVQDVAADWKADWFTTCGIDGSLQIWRVPGRRNRK